MDREKITLHIMHKKLHLLNQKEEAYNQRNNSKQHKSKLF